MRGRRISFDLFVCTSLSVRSIRRDVYRYGIAVLTIVLRGPSPTFSIGGLARMVKLPHRLYARDYAVAPGNGTRPSKIRPRHQLMLPLSVVSGFSDQ